MAWEDRGRYYVACIRSNHLRKHILDRKNHKLICGTKFERCKPRRHGHDTIDAAQDQLFGLTKICIKCANKEDK